MDVTPSTSSSAAASLSAETLLSLLECPVCLEPCIPPIYACSIGHKICKGCAPNIHRCPVCRSGYMGTRDFVAEDLYVKLSEAGLVPGVEEAPDDTDSPIECHLGTLSEELKMQCSLGALTNLPKFECYVAHLVHRHKVSKESLQVDMTFKKRFYYRRSFVRNGASKMLVLSCCDHSFLLMLNKTDEKIWIYVVVASSKIAKQFAIDLEIPLAGDDGVLASNVAKDVHSIKENPDNIYKNETCLFIKENILNEKGCHRIARTGRFWELKITIRRKSDGRVSVSSSTTGTVRTSPRRSAPLIAELRELPHFEDNVDDLGDQILGLQNQVRDFRIGLIDRMRLAGRVGANGARGVVGRPGISQLSSEEAPPQTGDGSIRNRALLYRSAGTSNLPADSTEPEATGLQSQIASRERSFGRLREHRDMIMELNRLRDQRETLDQERREREGRLQPRADRRTLRRTLPASSVITPRDFFTDSDEENEYIERLAREHINARQGSSEAGSAVSPTHSLGNPNPRRAVSATTTSRTESDVDPNRLRYVDILTLAHQRRRATSPETGFRLRDSSSTSDSNCAIC